MELLEKFDAVEITVDTRISEEDRKFCAAHETAYEAARTSLQELLYFWEDMQETQEALKAATGSKYSTYLPGKAALDISPAAIQNHIEELHDTLIENLVQYFNRAYHVNAKPYLIMGRLLPQEPKRDSDHIEEMKQYKEELRALSLSANQIVEEIFDQFDGRGLWEQALYELKINCHNAAWNTYRKVPCYERKKSVIRYLHGACIYKDWLHNGCWELNEGMKHLLHGISHYETGDFSVIPSEISRLLNTSYIYSDFTEFTDCKKISQVRLYKNGRADIRFTDETLARQFEEEYLGTVC